VGKSTLSRKSTTQGFGKEIYPFGRQAPNETSPEQFIVELSERSELFQFLGEFTSLIKGITSKGYMARFVEIYNDIHGCPNIYVRKLRERKGAENEFIIKNAYFSANSTVTPEMLKEHLTIEIMYGGFLPRWLLVPGVPKPRPRGRLDPNAFKLEENIKSVLVGIIRMEKDVKFVFSDEALSRYQVIEEVVYRKYGKVLPFAGRYLNYVVSFADILLVSDAIGVCMDEIKSLYDFQQLEQLISLKSLIQLDKVNNRIFEKFSGEVVSDKWLSNYYSSINYINRSKHIIVVKEYVDRAWEIIKQCLDYVETLVDYVELDKPIARVMDYLRKEKTASRSKVLQYTHINSKQMELAEETLRQRGDIKIDRKIINRSGRGSIVKKVYTWSGK